MEKNINNGFGFIYINAQDEEHFTKQLFSKQAADVLDHAWEQGSSLAIGCPGAGKTHLLERIQRESFERGLSSLAFQAHINGGSAKGVENALYVIDEFKQRHRQNAVLLIDNADYYGYSGQSIRRRYNLAYNHLAVAEHLIDLLGSNQSPIVIGTAHTQQWRDSHWRYGEKTLIDEVTPTAQKLLDSFSDCYYFDGTLSETEAAEIARQKVPNLSSRETSRFLEKLKEKTGNLFFRHLGMLSLAAFTDSKLLSAEVEKINEGTEALIEKARY